MNHYMAQTFFNKATIPFFVFITGASVLIIEILATRILAPYFGNTMFSISSVISVVLAALALGYFVGGKLADQHPKEELFYGLIALSGFCVIALHIMGIVFLSLFGYSLSLMQGPIISSMLLFFLQSFLLGMLSPFAIKLQAMRQENLGIGSVSGQIFFWSTAGSIAGSLLAGFFLIPNFGINTVILSVGFLLVILGLCSLMKIPFWAKLGLAVLCMILSLFFISEIDGGTPNVYAKDGVYQRITIYDDLHQGKPARFLFQDRNASAAAFIGSPDLAYDYTKYYALYQLFSPKVRQALVIGGGAYSVPKALLQDLPQVEVDVAEIEPSLFDLGKEYFDVPEDPRLKNYVEDGRRFLYDSEKKYDMIFSDAYSSFYSTPEHLTTQEFFQTAKSKLSLRGVFIANVIGSLSFEGNSFLFSEMKTFQSVFPNSYFFAVNSLDSPSSQNTIFVGLNSSDSVDLNSQTAKGSRNPIISGLAKKQIDVSKLDLSSAFILTDDYAPVEYLIAKELERMKY